MTRRAGTALMSPHRDTRARDIRVNEDSTGDRVLS
jgi:hypothetical protein